MLGIFWNPNIMYVSCSILNVNFSQLMISPVYESDESYKSIWEKRKVCEQASSVMIHFRLVDAELSELNFITLYVPEVLHMRPFVALLTLCHILSVIICKIIC